MANGLPFIGMQPLPSRAKQFFGIKQQQKMGKNNAVLIKQKVKFIQSSKRKAFY